MELIPLQKNILKRKIKSSIPLDNKTTLSPLKTKNTQDYPELRGAIEGITSPEQIKTLKGTRPVNDLYGPEKAFGAEKLKDPNFSKKFRKLQEKYKITTYA